MPWAPDYASVDELRDFVRIDDVADDTIIEAALSASSRAIDYACDPRPEHFRQFGQTDAVEDRYFTASRRGYDTPVRGQWVALVDDIATAVGLVVAADGGSGAYTPVEGTTLLPRNAAAHGRPATAILFAGSSMPTPPASADAVKVTGTWGWPAIPTAIHEACLMQSSRLIARRDAPFGVAGSPETGTEIRLLARLDPDVELMVRPYILKIGTVVA
ncbi:MAG TPA: hypothetical protein VIU11_14450 [Nakamurella sp.]